MKKRKVNKIFFLLLVALLSFFSFSSLIRSGFFPMHDDMQAMRLLQLDKCFKDGQIPCRWVPDMGYGYGYPQFNYYSPLPYYLMEVFHWLGFGFLSCVKIGFALSLILSGLGMFLLGHSLWGNWGGLVSAVFYVYAPYRAMDIYNRGAMAEAWAFVFLPLIFFFILEFAKKRKTKLIVYLALCLAGLFLSHNITSMLVFPFILAWIFLWLFLKKDKSLFFPLLIGLAWGAGLAGFFLLPVILEKGLVHAETMKMGYFNYLAHFLSLKQLFLKTHWGYGSSVLGPNEDVNFSIGIFHWLFGLIGSFSLLLLVRKKIKEKLIVVFLASSGLLAAFMTHQTSSWFWQKVEILSWVQFPWRFLVLTVFFFSTLTGVLISILKDKKRRIVLGLFLIFGVVFFNSFFFRPAEWLEIDDHEKFSGQLWEKQLTISIFDYLPIFAEAPPGQKAPSLPWAVEGKIEVIDFQKGTDWQKGKIKVFSDQSLIRLALFYFPGWQVFIDGEKVPLEYNNNLGLISFRLGQGEYFFKSRLFNTWPRIVGNSLSLVSLLAVFLLLLKIRPDRTGRKK